jgi:hypothetical protein
MYYLFELISDKAIHGVTARADVPLATQIDALRTLLMTMVAEIAHLKLSDEANMKRKCKSCNLIGHTSQSCLVDQVTKEDPTTEEYLAEKKQEQVGRRKLVRERRIRQQIGLLEKSGLQVAKKFREEHIPQDKRKRVHTEADWIVARAKLIEKTMKAKRERASRKGIRPTFEDEQRVLGLYQQLQVATLDRLFPQSPENMASFYACAKPEHLKAFARKKAEHVLKKKKDEGFVILSAEDWDNKRNREGLTKRSPALGDRSQQLFESEFPKDNIDRGGDYNNTSQMKEKEVPKEGTKKKRDKNSKKDDLSRSLSYTPIRNVTGVTEKIHDELNRGEQVGFQAKDTVPSSPLSTFQKKDREKVGSLKDSKPHSFGNKSSSSDDARLDKRPPARTTGDGAQKGADSKVTSGGKVAPGGKVKSGGKARKEEDRDRPPPPSATRKVKTRADGVNDVQVEDFEAKAVVKPEDDLYS